MCAKYRCSAKEYLLLCPTKIGEHGRAYGAKNSFLSVVDYAHGKFIHNK